MRPLLSTQHTMALARLLARSARAPLARSYSDAASVKFNAKPKKSDADYTPEELKYNFFNLPLSMSKKEIASKFNAYDSASFERAVQDAIDEKIDTYEPKIKPWSNQVRAVGSGLARAGGCQFEFRSAIVARSLSCQTRDQHGI